MALTVAAVEARTPAQQHVLDQLRSGPRPAFPGDLRDRLRAELEDGLDGLAADVDPERPLVLTKHGLAGVHGCQVKFLADAAERFMWSVPKARGTVAHKAIELSMNWKGEPHPLDLVDDALARLIERDDGLAEWLRMCSDVERAELRSDANGRVASFLEGWPALQKAWIPVAESPSRAELCDGRVVLKGKVDLTLGRSVGTVASKVLVDLKTGGFSPDHLHDLRFYALLETLKVGVPPRRVASCYLESGRIVPEDVTEGILGAAVARTLAGAAAIVALRRSDAAPMRRPGPSCRWCPVRPGCPDGQAWIAGTEDTG
jgi:hypothetical protein